jgi:hypothetical protein
MATVTNFCPRCGKPTGSGDAFCRACGAGLGVGTAEIAGEDAPDASSGSSVVEISRDVIAVQATHAERLAARPSSVLPLASANAGAASLDNPVTALDTSPAAVGDSKLALRAAEWLGKPVRAACFVGWRGARATQAGSGLAGGFLAGMLLPDVGGIDGLLTGAAGGGIAASVGDRASAPKVAGATLTARMAMLVSGDLFLLVAIGKQSVWRPKEILMAAPLSALSAVEPMGGRLRNRFRIRLVNELAPLELEGDRGSSEQVVKWLGMRLAAAERISASRSAITFANCCRCAGPSTAESPLCSQCTDELRAGSFGLASDSELQGIWEALRAMWTTLDTRSFDDAYDPEITFHLNGEATIQGRSKVIELYDGRFQEWAKAKPVDLALHGCFADGVRTWLVFAIVFGPYSVPVPMFGAITRRDSHVLEFWQWSLRTPPRGLIPVAV